MLKNRRKKLGISQRKLAKRLNVDRSYLSKVENSKFNNVSVEFIRKISKELKLNPLEVFLFFYLKLWRHNGITSYLHLIELLWGVIMREKTTIYIEEDLKKKVQIKLIENEGQVSLSTLINKLLEEWYRKETSQ